MKSPLTRECKLQGNIYARLITWGTDLDLLFISRLVHLVIDKFEMGVKNVTVNSK